MSCEIQPAHQIHQPTHQQGTKWTKMPISGQIWPFWSIWARPCRLIQCPVGESVGGCGAQAVSRKTPIYFILSLNPKVFLLCYWIRNSDVSVHNKLCTLYILRGRVTSPFRKEWGQFWQKCDALNFWLPFSANLTKPWCVWVKMCIQLQHLSHLASSQTVSIRIYNSTSLSNISIFLWVLPQTELS